MSDFRVTFSLSVNSFFSEKEDAVAMAPESAGGSRSSCSLSTLPSSKETGRKYKDGWWSAVGRQSLSKRPPGPIPSLLRQSDLWARAVAAAAATEDPPCKSAAIKERFRIMLSPYCVRAKTSPSEKFPGGGGEDGRRVVSMACEGRKKDNEEIAPKNCFARTFWSGTECVWVSGGVQRRREVSVAEGEEGKAIWRTGEVIAFICGLIVIILMIMALASTDWLMAAGWRQGLFIHCIGENAPTPLPFNQQAPPDCYQARDVAYIRAAAALCIITLITDVFATILTGLGLKSKDHRTKYKYYRVAVYIMVLSLISILIALVVYPVCFAAELNEGNRTVWEFGWAYGVGWGAAIFLFGGVVLLLCDKESEEIYYKERKIVHDTDSRA